MISDAGDDRTIRFLGNNVMRVLVSGAETGGGYCVMELTVQPNGGATALHTDRWVETFHVIEGDASWTLERDGRLDTWIARPGDTVVVPAGAKHRFAGGAAGCRMLTAGPGEFERFFRALAAAWAGPFDREKTPAAVAPVFEAFGMQLCPDAPEPSAAR
jgi:quercetin dioxygenase-like cupin family protein